MATRPRAAQVRQDRTFKGRQFTAEVILWARLAKGSVRRSRMEGQGEGVRWYVAYPISYRQLEEMMEEHGVEVDHATLNRWVLKYVPLLKLEFRIRKQRFCRKILGRTCDTQGCNWVYPASE